jgi:hypothetical protein
MIEAVHTSEMLVYFETTQRYIPGYLHARHCENLKSQNMFSVEGYNGHKTLVLNFANLIWCA